MELPILIAIAFVAGFISSIAGAGGLITVPALLWFGIPPLPTLAVNKFQSIFGTLSSTLNYYRKGFIDFRRLRRGLACALVGSVAGAQCVQWLGNQQMELIIPWLLLLLAGYTLFTPRLSDEDAKPRLTPLQFDLIACTGLGFYGGFFGPGMGSLFALALIGLMGLNARSATAHAKPLVLISNASAALIFIGNGQLIWELAIGMAVAQAIGARIGSNMVISQGAKLVKPVLILALLAVAVKMLLTG
ncbi:TSUP family transporter [Motiliproteus sp.]|uniref:TSUP family transporter n=1 Tax=Motiliproteus sp. TaxID=1898955 RepID=UPI003BAA4927